jgi:hypothetical protein
MEQHNNKEYKICLTRPDGGRQIVSLTPAMTMGDLAKTARRHCLGSDDAVVQMTTGFPRPQKLPSSSDSIIKARSVLPHMTRVHCTIIAADQPVKSSEEEKEEATSAGGEGGTNNNEWWACSACTYRNQSRCTSCDVCGASRKSKANKKRPADNETNRTTVDLTITDEEEEETDPTFANKKSRSSTHRNLTTASTDEALARALQQEEGSEDFLASATARRFPSLPPPEELHQRFASSHHQTAAGRENLGGGYTRASMEVNPSQVDRDYVWIFADGPDRTEQSQVLGKWLVFGSEKKIDSLWQSIWPKVVSGELHAAQAKVATKFNTKTGSSSYVICVYTTETRMDDVAFKLIRIVKRDLRYKTDADTIAGKYAPTTNQPISVRTLYWKNGNPTFTKPTTMKA